MLLYYVRHGDPIYNPDSLTPLGQRQAEAVAKRLAVHGIDKIFASTSERTRLTAVPTSELLKKEIIELDWCNENKAWDDFAIPLDETHKRWIFQHPTFRYFINKREIINLGEHWYEHPDMAKYSFRSGIERIARESDDFLKSIGYIHDRDAMGYNCAQPNDMRVALFAHQGFGIAFLSSILDIPYPMFCNRFDLTHSSVTVIEFENDAGFCIPRVLTLSNDSHTYREGLPTKYNNRIYI